MAKPKNIEMSHIEVWSLSKNILDHTTGAAGKRSCSAL